MKRRSARIALATFAALPGLALPALAGADPVNEFNIQIKDLRAGGGYTVVLSANQFDTTGAPPLQMTANTLRFASGVRIRPQFLGRRYACDVTRMRDVILENPDRPPVARTRRFADLAATLGRIRKKLTPEQIAIVETCVRSRIGDGVVVADARPYAADPVPAKLTLYLAKARRPGAVASIGAVVVLDEGSKPYREKRLLPLIGPPVFFADVFDEPSADGRYGYRLALPTPPTGLVLDVKASVAELRVTVPGLTERTKVVTCARRAAGRCAARKVTERRTFWLTQPSCAAASALGFEQSYRYETGLMQTKAIDVPCPRFRP